MAWVLDWFRRWNARSKSTTAAASCGEHHCHGMILCLRFVFQKLHVRMPNNPQLSHNARQTTISSHWLVGSLPIETKDLKTCCQVNMICRPANGLSDMKRFINQSKTIAHQIATNKYRWSIRTCAVGARAFATSGWT